jgi:hypothetical protein
VNRFPTPLKGLCHLLNIFLDACTIRSVFSVHAQMVSKVLVCLVQQKNYYEVLITSLKTLTNYKNCSVSGINLLLNLQLGSGTTLGDTGGYKKAGTSSLKRVTGRNSSVSK